MATTSPDNIWSPDSGDDYALTVDLAAMADTVQDAITDVRSDIPDLNTALVGQGVGLRTATAHTTSPTAYTPLVISWSIEDFDTSGFHAPAQPTRMTAPVAGLYQVTAKVRTSSTVYASGLQFGVNGTIDASSRQISSVGTSSGTFSSLTKTYSLGIGGYVEVFSLGQVASLSLDIAECYAQMIRIR